MIPELTTIVGHVLAISGLCVGVFLICRSHRAQEQRLVAQNKFIRQLLDRLATHEYGVKDPAIGRIHAAIPPSVKEEQVNPLPRGLPPRDVEENVKPKRKPIRVQKVNLDMAEEFDR